MYHATANGTVWDTQAFALANRLPTLKHTDAKNQTDTHTAALAPPVELVPSKHKAKYGC